MELNDLAQSVEYRTHLENLTRRLYQVIDPNEVIEQYTNDQKEMISALGGRDNILSMWDFNHTPVELNPKTPSIEFNRSRRNGSKSIS